MTRQEEITLARMVNMRLVIDEFEDITIKELHKAYERATKKLLKDVKAAAGKPGRIWTNTRKVALLEETQLMYAALEEQFTGVVADKVADVGVFSYEEMNNISSWDGRVNGFNNVALSKPQLVQLVTTQKLGNKTLREWVGSSLAPDFDTIKQQIQQGLIEGRGFQPVLNQTADMLGITRGSKKFRDLETTIKTYYQSVNVKAQLDVFGANSDVVKKVEWSAIMENGNTKTGRGTCPRCMALDGLQWPTGSPAIPNCPLHARCRCLLYPITLTWRELGFDVDEMKDVYQPWTIRNLDTKSRGIIDFGWTDQNYPGFWAQQGKKFQDLAIGPVRAEMVRKGMNFRSIIDKKGNLIPIKDLPKKWQLKKKKPKPKPKKKKPPGGTTPAAAPLSSKLTLPVPGTAPYIDIVQPHQVTEPVKKLLATVDDWTFVERGSVYWKSGAFHNSFRKHINMGTHDVANRLNDGTTFLHEFGHRVDNFYGPTIAAKWGDEFIDNVSTTRTWTKAQGLDQRGLNNEYNDLWTKMPDKYKDGRRSARKIRWGMDDMTADELLGMGGWDSQKVIDLVKAEGVSAKYQPFLNLTRQLEGHANVEKNWLAQMYLAIRMSDKYDNMAFIMDGWLKYANYMGHSGTGLHGSLSDLIGATTKEKWGLGHGKSYYNADGTKRGKEAFAQLLCTYGDEDALAIIKLMTPNQYGVFEQFLKDF